MQDTPVKTYYFTYDKLHNPVRYKINASSLADAETKDTNMVWTRGNLLQKYNNVTFTYDRNGARISKSGSKGTIRYMLDGTKVIGEICSDGIPFYYHYDADCLCGVSIGNGVTDKELHCYTVMCDSEKSVRKVFYRGMLLASIDYDTFGNFTITKNPEIASGTINYTDQFKEFFEVTSIRWKGYIYDSETGFYYIDGRYYDPETGRFINAALSADGIVNAANDVFGNNTFLLSGNSFRMADSNPMDCSPYYETEPSTDSKVLNWWQKLVWHIMHPSNEAKIVLGILLIVALAVLTVVTSGATSCLFATMLEGAITGAFIGAATGAVIGGIAAAVKGDSGEDIVNAMFDGFADGFLSGAISGAISRAISWANNPACFIAGTLVLARATVSLIWLKYLRMTTKLHCTKIQLVKSIQTVY